MAVVVEHDHLIELAPKVLSKVTECVVVGQGGKAEDNVLGWNGKQKGEKDKREGCQAILIRNDPPLNYEAVVEDIDWLMAVW